MTIEATQSSATSTETTPAAATVKPATAEDTIVDLDDSSRDAVVRDILEARAALAKGTETGATDEEETPQTQAGEATDAAEKKPEPPKEPEPQADAAELAAAKRLNEIAQASARARKESAEAKKAKADAESLAKDVEARAKAIQEREDKIKRSATSGKRVDALLSSGFTLEDLRGSFFVDAMNELGELEEQGETTQSQSTEVKKQVQDMSEEQIQALVEKILVEKKQKLEYENNKRLDEADERQRDAYFNEFRKLATPSDYPLVRAINPSMGELSSYAVAHYRSTNKPLQPEQLLKHFEEKYRNLGLTVARTESAKTTTAAASTTKTITPAATSDSGTSLDKDKTTKPVTRISIREESKAEFLRDLEAQRRSRKTG
jgi:hypothetical protein